MKKTLLLQKSKAVAIQHFHREQERRHQCETDLLDERRRAATLSDRVAALEAQLTIFQETQLAGNSRSSEVGVLMCDTQYHLIFLINLPVHARAEKYRFDNISQPIYTHALVTSQSRP